MRMRGYILFLLITTSLAVFGQSHSEKEKNWTLNGYVKQLQSVVFIKQVDDYLLDQLIHNRLRYTKKFSRTFNLRLELRNRIFYGDQIKLNPGYAEGIESANNDWLDLSVHLVDKNNWLLNSTLDRAFVEYEKGSWEIRVGRQRINWGINTIWNPNDIFNAYSFVDFDYEERPGSDAIKIRRYLGFASSIELAYRVADLWGEAVLASRWKTNLKGYDFQVIAGWAENYWTIGGGWAGNLKNAGFKGELSYFIGNNNELDNSFTFTTSIDYSFRNSLYMMLGYLYNSNGLGAADVSQLFAFELNARNLYPYKHSMVLTASYPVTPLVNAGLSLLYSPVKAQALFLNPTFGVSIAQNWDLDMVGQIAFNKDGDKYVAPVQAFFLRTKFSF